MQHLSVEPPHLIINTHIQMLRNSCSLNNTNFISWLAAWACPRTAETHAVMDARRLFRLLVFVSYIFLQLSLLHVAASVVGVCARTWMTMCFQQMAFLLPALWRNLSSFPRLLSHNTSAAPIPAKRNATIALSPRHPAEADRHGSSLQVRSFLAVRISYALQWGISNETRSDMVVFILSSCLHATKFSLFFPPSFGP